MPRPGWKNEININTVVIVVGFIAMGAGWGMAWQSMKAAQDQNAKDIARVERSVNLTEDDIRRDIVQLQKESSTNASAFKNIEFRTSRLEDGFVTVTANTRDLEKTINGMASDIRVMREILGRLDSATDREVPPKR